MKHRGFSIIFLLVVFLLTGFAKKQFKTQEEMMQERIEEKLAVVRSVQWKACYERIEADAVAYVDSIIVQKINFQISDTIRTPGKPVKPPRPYDTLILDTTPIKPIFKDTLKEKKDLIPIGPLRDTINQKI